MYKVKKEDRIILKFLVFYILQNKEIQNQSSDDLDLQIKIVIGRSLFDLIGDHFLPFF